MSQAQRMHFFTGRVPNDNHCADDTLEFVKRGCLLPWHSLFLFFWYSMNLLIDSHFEFTNGLLFVLLRVLPEASVIKMWELQFEWMRKPLGFMVNPDQPIREWMVKTLYYNFGCMWNFPILFEPLHISIHITTYSKCPPELVQHITAMLFCDSNCFLVFVFKPKRSIYNMFWDGYQGRTFHRVNESQKHLVFGFCGPVDIVRAINTKCALSLKQSSSRKTGSYSIFFSTSSPSVNVFA